MILLSGLVAWAIVDLAIVGLAMVGRERDEALGALFAGVFMFIAFLAFLEGDEETTTRMGDSVLARLQDRYKVVNSVSSQDISANLAFLTMAFAILDVAMLGSDPFFSQFSNAFSLSMAGSSGCGEGGGGDGGGCGGGGCGGGDGG